MRIILNKTAGAMVVKAEVRLSEILKAVSASDSDYRVVSAERINGVWKVTFRNACRLGDVE